MPRDLRVGELQFAILDVLWQHGEATVNDVHAALRPARDLATTTIATMLTKMERKGVVAHRVEGRRFVYRAAVKRDAVHRSMVRDLVDRLFGGDSAALVSHLVSEGEIDRRELDELRTDVAKRSQEDRRGR